MAADWDRVFSTVYRAHAARVSHFAVDIDRPFQRVEK